MEACESCMNFLLYFLGGCRDIGKGGVEGVIFLIYYM